MRYGTDAEGDGTVTCSPRVHGRRPASCANYLEANGGRDAVRSRTGAGSSARQHSDGTYIETVLALSRWIDDYTKSLAAGRRATQMATQRTKRAPRRAAWRATPGRRAAGKMRAQPSTVS